MAEGTGSTEVTVLDHLLALLAEKELRDQQRFDAQQKAVEAALLAQEKAVQTAMTAAEKAVNKAEIAAEKRFESVNEFRGQLTDQAATFLARTEYLTAHQSLLEKITDLAARADRIEGVRTGGRELWGYLVGAIGLVAGITALILR